MDFETPLRSDLWDYETVEGTWTESETEVYEAVYNGNIITLDLSNRPQYVMTPEVTKIGEPIPPKH